MNTEGFRRASAFARSSGPAVTRNGWCNLWFVGLLLVATWTPLAEAQAQSATGRIIGRVVSTHTGEPLAGVQVSIPATGTGTITDVSGRYVLSGIPAGTQSVVAQSLGFGTKTVTGVEVASGAATTLDISLAPEAVAIEGLTVSATRERGSTTALLSNRQKAAAVVDALGAEQISMTPDGDAAAALKRVPGVSVVDGKFVYVRGLGERYGATTLNGAPLASPIPDKKAVPLDLIPSNLLESVVTAKTYLPDQPGDYAGGLVQLETRNYPTSQLLRLSTSIGFDTNTSLATGLSYAGGAYDWLGFDDGTRELPVSREEPIRLPTQPAARQDFVHAVTGPWVPTQEDVPLNQSYGITYGNEFEVGGRPLGFIASGSYSNSYSTTSDLTERYYAAGLGPSLQVDYDGESTTHSIALGGLLNAGLTLNPASRLAFTAVYNRLVDDEARTLGGLYESQGPYIQAPRLQYIANELINGQLKGEHLFASAGDLDLEWRVGYSQAARYEPNTRTVLYQAEEEEGTYRFYTSPSSGLVFHQGLDDQGLNGAVDLDLPFTFRRLPATLSVGGSAEMRDREVYTRRFRLVPNHGGLSADLSTLGPDELFVPSRIGEQFRVIESTFREDNYNADQSVYASYAMVDAEVLPRLRMVAGARIERAEQMVNAVDLFETALKPLPGASLENTDVLPALNLTYALAEEMNLRAAVSQTVARPQFRELTPFLYADYYGGLVTRGNPYLERSRILNGDLRWEWFFRPGAVFSLGGFAKRFDAPIEPFAIVLGSAPGQTWVNTDQALLYGAEVEFRSSLGILAESLEDLSFNANATLATSEVESDTVVIYGPDGGRPLRLASTEAGDRPLFGQSPYVLNLGLSYRHPRTETSASLLFNRFGRRLEAFGGAALPDIYEQGRSKLDLVVEQPLWGGMEMKLSAGNLLGSEVEFVQTFPSGETVTTTRYDEGRSFSLSLSWEPGSR